MNILRASLGIMCFLVLHETIARAQNTIDSTSPCSKLLAEFLSLEDDAPPLYAELATRNAGVIRDRGFDEYLRQVGGIDKTLSEARRILAKNQKILAALNTGEDVTVVTHPQPGENTPVADPLEALTWQDSLLETKIKLLQCWQSQPALSSKCAQAIDYRDHGLLRQWDQAVNQYTIQAQGKASVEDIKKKLLDDSWWATSSGPDIASEIKFACDSFNDLIGSIFPEGEIAQIGKPVIHHAPEILRAFNAGEPLVTLGKENADAAAKEAWQDVGKDILGQAGSAIGLMQDIESRAKTKNDWLELRATVQEQVESLDRTISSYDDKIRKAGEKLDALEEVVIAIDQACNQPYVPIIKP
jgi:hypothetical protein